MQPLPIKIPHHIQEWFKNRGVSEQVLSDFNIGWDGNRIVFPIFSPEGEFLFNKYRRNPESNEGSKYTYETGGTSQLYAADKIKHAKIVFVAEGETDTLLLWSRGLPAVTSTGGAGTFKLEWGNFLVDKELYVFMDNDDAGIQGAFNVQQKLPWAKLAWPPHRISERNPIKDMTDVYMDAPGSFRRIILQMMADAKQYYIPPRTLEWPERKKDLVSMKKDLTTYMDGLLLEIRTLKNEWKDYRAVEILLKYCGQRYAEISRKLKWFEPVLGMNRIASCKQVPIDTLVSVNQQGFANCVAHEDKNPSMYWHKKDNHVHCYSCGFHGDGIDVVQKRDRVGKAEAIDIILHI